MPARREPQTPPTTPPQKSRSRRNGSGSSSGSSINSQKYTAYLKERPSSRTSNGNGNGIYLSQENPFSREDEIFGRLKFSNSQPTIYNPQDIFNNIDDDFTNQFIPPIDRDIVGTPQQQQQQQRVRQVNNNNNNNNIPNNPTSSSNNNSSSSSSSSSPSSSLSSSSSSILKSLSKGLGIDFLIGLLAKLLNFIGYTIFLMIYFIKTCFNFVWNNLTGNENGPFTHSTTTISTTATATTMSTTINNNKSNKWLIFLLLFIIVLLLLSNIKFGVENKTLLDYFPSHYNKIHIWPLDSTTYKIQPIRGGGGGEISNGNNNDNNNDSIILTLEDFKQMIRAEVKNLMNSEDGKRLPSLPTEPLRTMINDEVRQITNEFKNIVSSEVKKGLTNIRTDPTRFRGSLRGVEMLEIIRKEARQVVKDELLKYSQDKLNKPDFALYSGGAKVISKFTSKTYELWPDRWYQKGFAYLSGQGILRGKPPVTAISHDTNVGQCWPFPGQVGQLAVLLNRRVYVTAVTYDHVSKDIAVDVLSAPKDFEVWGIIDDGTGGRISKDDDEDLDIDDTLRNYMESTEDSCGRREDGEYVPGKINNNNLHNDNGKDDDDSSGLSYIKPPFENLTNGELRLGSSPLHFYLGKFTYDIDGLPVQTFEISQNILKNNKPIRAIIMKVTSNWGKPEYTCLYRFRVHGDPADKAEN